MMDSEEREIFFYLKGQPECFVSGIAIGRFAGGRRKARQDPDWAKPVLMRMAERGILETDAAGCYRLTPLPPPPTTKSWVSPQMASILKRSGKNFKALHDHAGDAEAYYDQL